MYKLHFSFDLFDKITKLGVDYPSLLNKAKSLTENPTAVAIKTNIPLFCDYYVNAGRHAILFDLNETEELVYIKHILLKARLYKILNGNNTI